MKSLVAYKDSGSGGGDVEDVLRRLGNVESDVSELKTQVGSILATIPHLATKADVLDVKRDVADLRAEMAAGLGSVRSEMAAGLGSVRAEMAAQYGSLRADMAVRETAFIKWMIGTVLTTAGLAFTIAKFVH